MFSSIWGSSSNYRFSFFFFSETTFISEKTVEEDFEIKEDI